ncbi:major facilitator superfamily domain-containing protein [Mycena epipterygia]|nr:major facilitator superfamily domain-containing protein [Mycena epipterygia]
MPAPSSLSAVLPKRSALRSVTIVILCTAAMVVNNSNNTSVSISLPNIGRELHAQEVALQWLVSAYPLSSGCLLLFFGRLADLHGRKNAFLLGSAFLAAFTLACGFAKDEITLAVLRGLQGICGAATIPASLGILAHAFPPSRARSAAFATFAAGAPVGGAIGMAIGGIMTELTRYTWRTPFFFSAGLSLATMVGGAVVFDADVPSLDGDRRVDWLGAALVSTGLVLVVFVLGQGELAADGWASPYIIVLLILGLLLLGLFFFWQLYLERSHPLLPSPPSRSSTSEGLRLYSWARTYTPPPLMRPGLFSRARGRVGVMYIVAMLEFAAFMGWGFWVQLYYQSYIGYSPVRTVVRLVPMFICGLLCNALVALIVGRMPIVWLIVAGLTLTSVSALLFALVVPSAPYWAFGFPAAVCSVVGADFVFATGTLFVAGVSAPGEQSVAGGIFQTMTQLGSSIGVTISTIVFNRVKNHIEMQGPPPTDILSAYHDAMWTCFGFGMSAALLSLVFFRGLGAIGYRGTKETPDSEASVGAGDVHGTAEKSEPELEPERIKR